MCTRKMQTDEQGEVGVDLYYLLADTAQSGIFCVAR